MIRALFVVVTFCFFSSTSWSASYGPYPLITPIATDGDTIKANMPVWPGLFVEAGIRVRGVDTPETNGSSTCERDLARRAKAFTEMWITSNQPITISGVEPDKYSGRYAAVVTGRGGSVLATELINAGHGRFYNGGARSPWCQP